MPFEHYCHCGKWGAFGYGVRLLRSQNGTHFCREHRPANPDQFKLKKAQVTNMIPPRFKASCELCREELDVRADGIHRWTAGWVRQRGGGSGSVALPQRANRWAHPYCVTRAIERMSKGGEQAKLFEK